MKYCSIIGHRKIEISDDFKLRLERILKDLIENNVKVFLFGSKSMFNDVCYDIISSLKTTYQDIKRVYVRAEYIKTNNEYDVYLKSQFEESYYYDKNLYSNRLNYVKRNETLIDKSDICLFYYNDNYRTKNNTKSGTKLAYDYALKKKKEIINIYK